MRGGSFVKVANAEIIWKKWMYINTVQRIASIFSSPLLYGTIVSFLRVSVCSATYRSKKMSKCGRNVHRQIIKFRHFKRQRQQKAFDTPQYTSDNIVRQFVDYDKILTTFCDTTLTFVFAIEKYKLWKIIIRCTYLEISFEWKNTVKSLVIFQSP